MGRQVDKEVGQGQGRPEAHIGQLDWEAIRVLLH